MYNGGFHHSKIMMVDSLFCTVGSTNLNSRSLRYDYEVNAFIFDKETTHELSTMFDHDKLDSTLLTKEEYKKTLRMETLRRLVRQSVQSVPHKPLPLPQTKGLQIVSSPARTGLIPSATYSPCSKV